MNIQSFDLLSLASSWLAALSTPSIELNFKKILSFFLKILPPLLLFMMMESMEAPPSFLQFFALPNSPSPISTSGKSSKLLVSSIDRT